MANFTGDLTEKNVQSFNHGWDDATEGREPMLTNDMHYMNGHRMGKESIKNSEGSNE